MDCNSQFELWKDQVRKLKSSMSSLSETEPRNVLQHFFLQAAQSELKSELEPVKNLLKEIICSAIDQAPHLDGNIRQKSAKIVKMFIDEPILNDITLADIRNIIAFDIFKQCGIRDTFFLISSVVHAFSRAYSATYASFFSCSGVYCVNGTKTRNVHIHRHILASLRSRHRVSTRIHSVEKK